jgi:hypothetical protein
MTYSAAIPIFNVERRTPNIEYRIALSDLNIQRWTPSAFEVPGRGLEPLRIAPPDPKSGASANFATLAT